MICVRLRPQILSILDPLSVRIRTKSCGSVFAHGCVHSSHISVSHWFIWQVTELNTDRRIRQL